MPSRLAALTTTMSGTARIELRGELTGETIQVLIHAVRLHLESKVPAALCIDMSRLELLDARGLAALIVVRKMAADADIPIAFQQPSPLATRILEFAGLGELYRHP